MKAYKMEEVTKAVLIKEARLLVKMGLMSQEYWEQLKNTHTILNQNSRWYFRILFFLLGSLLVGLTIGFLALILFLGNSVHQGDIVLCILSLIGSVAAAELIASMKYYAHGLSDAFILSIQMMSFITLFTFMDNMGSHHFWIAFFGLSTTSFYCYMRFIHSMSLLISVVALIATIILLFIQLGTIATLLLPFVLMLMSGGLFYGAKTLGQKTTNLLLSKDLYVVYYLSFVLFYLASNYYLIRETSNEILSSGDAMNKDIPFSYFFQACSYILPIGYMALGLWCRDRIIIWIGVLVGIIAVFTFRYYHHLLPTEIVLTLSGSILLVASLYLIKKLKYNTYGFTFKKDPTLDNFSAIELEVLQAALKNINSTIQPHSSTEFNNGTSSGGGASGNF
jgi:hypothetical protein